VFGVMKAHGSAELKAHLKSVRSKYQHVYLTQPDKSALTSQQGILDAMGNLPFFFSLWFFFFSSFLISHVSWMALVDLTFEAVKNITPSIHNLRKIKSPAEKDLMRKACQISARGFQHVSTPSPPSLPSFIFCFLMNFQ